MATSMVTAVLEIEREAEALIKSAEDQAAKLIEDAKAKCAAAAETSKGAADNEIKALEAQAKENRALKIKELAAAGEANLSRVRNVSDAAFDKGVRMIMAALTGK